MATPVLAVSSPPSALPGGRAAMRAVAPFLALLLALVLAPLPANSLAYAKGPPLRAAAEAGEETVRTNAACTDAVGAAAFRCGDAALAHEDASSALRFHARALETLDPEAERALAELALTRAVDDALLLGDPKAAEVLLNGHPEFDDGGRRKTVRRHRAARRLACASLCFLALFTLGSGALASWKRRAPPSLATPRPRVAAALAVAGAAAWLGGASATLARTFAEGASSAPFWLFSLTIPAICLIAFPYARTPKTRRFAAPLAAIATVAAAIVVLYTSDRTWLANLL